MSDKDDKRITRLPATRPTGSEVSRSLESTRKALSVRDPVTGFFHGLGSKAAARALQRSTGEADALAGNLNAQNSVVQAMMRLRDTMDDYQAREALAEEYYDNATDRAKRELARRTAQSREAMHKAQREALNAKYGLQSTVRNKDKNFRIGDVRKEARIAEFEALLPEEDALAREREPNPSGSLLDQIKELYERGLQEKVSRTADGKSTDDLDKALDEIERILRAVGTI
jgi:DNA-directed RNA polymerase subunit K/omega